MDIMAILTQAINEGTIPFLIRQTLIYAVPLLIVALKMKYRSLCLKTTGWELPLKCTAILSARMALLVSVLTGRVQPQ